jgi:hypothetical protein
MLTMLTFSKHAKSYQKLKKFTPAKVFNRFNTLQIIFHKSNDVPHKNQLKNLVHNICLIHTSVGVRNMFTWILRARYLQRMTFPASVDILLHIMLGKCTFDHLHLGCNETHFKIQYFLLVYYLKIFYLQYTKIQWFQMLEKKNIFILYLTMLSKFT